MDRIPLGSVQLFVKFNMRLGWIVDGHVDIDAAREALEAVVSRWRVLGSRIQGDGKGTPWHLVIPPEFSPSSPAFHFTHSTSPEPLTDVYPFSQSSHFSSQIYTKPPLSIFGPSPLYFSFPQPPSAPVLYLHIGHYPGLTAVGITTSHAVFDAMALGLVMREWEEALRNITAYRAKGKDKSDLGQLGIRPWLAESVKLEPGWMPVGWSIFSWADMWSKALKTIREYIEDKFLGLFEDRCMTIPKSFFEDMKADAHLELLQSHPDGPHFITSTADVVQGWLWKNVVSNMSDSATLTSVLSTASTRNILNYTKIPCFNAVAIINTPALSIREARALSIAELSRRSRRFLEEQRKPDMLNKTFTWRECQPKWSFPMQEGGQEVLRLSNMAKSHTNTIDLRPAVEQGSGDGRVLYSSLVRDNGLTTSVNGFTVQETPDGLALRIFGHTRKSVWESMRLSVEASMCYT